MTSKNELCRKMQQTFPRLGACGVDFDIDYDERAGAWSVEFHRDRQHLQFLVDEDEPACSSWDEGETLPRIKARLRRFLHELRAEH